TIIALRTFTAIVLSNASGVVSRNDWGIEIPALFTSSSIGPPATPFSAAPRVCPASDRSAAIVSHPISLLSASRSAGVPDTATTPALHFARRRQISRPIPLPAPVTSARFPPKSIFISCSGFATNDVPQDRAHDRRDQHDDDPQQLPAGVAPTLEDLHDHVDV